MDYPTGKFGAILMDPPWRYVTYDKKRAVPGRALDGDPYPTMTFDELAAMPVTDFAAKDCALFMWVIGSHVDQAMLLGKALGFTYKTDVIIWAKIRREAPGEPLFEMPPIYPIGMGKWTRKQAETCYLFTRGSPKRLNANVPQLLLDHRREHSRKPDEQYERVEALVGGPYLEMFSRTTRPGWTSWGNEVGKF